MQPPALDGPPESLEDAMTYVHRSHIDHPSAWTSRSIGGKQGPSTASIPGTSMRST
jgi:hypothetical protein